MNGSDNYIHRHQNGLAMKGHLQPASLSLYINFFATLSDHERASIRGHLDACDECRRLFDKVFDDEMEFDPLAKDMTLAASESGVYSGNGWRLRFSGPPDKHLILEKIPDTSKARLKFGDQVFRIIEMKPGLTLHLENSLQPDNVMVRAAFNEKRSLSLMATPVMRYLAAAVILILLGVIIYKFIAEPPVPAVTQEHTPQSGTAKPDESVAEPTPRKNIESPVVRQSPGTLQADRFAANDVLESFIDRTYRSEIKIEATGPDNGIDAAPPITFSWTAPGGTSVAVSVVDNQNSTVWTMNSVTGQATMKQKLKPGLYYWLLKRNGQTVVVRKFFIR